MSEEEQNIETVEVDESINDPVIVETVAESTEPVTLKETHGVITTIDKTYGRELRELYPERIETIRKQNSLLYRWHSKARPKHGGKAWDGKVVEAHIQVTEKSSQFLFEYELRLSVMNEGEVVDSVTLTKCEIREAIVRLQNAMRLFQTQIQNHKKVVDANEYNVTHFRKALNDAGLKNIKLLSNTSGEATIGQLKLRVHDNVEGYEGKWYIEVIAPRSNLGKVVKGLASKNKIKK